MCILKLCVHLVALFLNSLIISTLTRMHTSWRSIFPLCIEFRTAQRIFLNALWNRETIIKSKEISFLSCTLSLFFFYKNCGYLSNRDLCHTRIPHIYSLFTNINWIFLRPDIPYLICLHYVQYIFFISNFFFFFIKKPCKFHRGIWFEWGRSWLCCVHAAFFTNA